MFKAILTTLGTIGFMIVAAAMACATPPGSGWEIHFADEFEGDTLDLMKWDYNYRFGNYHNHNAVVSETNVLVGGGKLTLHAEYGTPSWAKETHTHGGVERSIDFTSGAINSSQDYLVEYGYIEARLKLPPSVGSWPAFWTLEDEGWPPEIDIMEHFMQEDTFEKKQRYSWGYIYNTWPNQQNQRGYPNTGIDLTADFHDYAVEWTPTYLKFFLDGNLMGSVTDPAKLAYLDEGHYIILNYAVGGNPVPYPPDAENFNDDYEVDWVRVWKQDSTGTTHTWTNAAGGAWDADGNWDTDAPQVGTQTAAFGTVAAPDVAVDWSQLTTIGNVAFSGSTNYTLGDGDESLMLAPADRSGASTIDLTGAGQHVINSRLDLWGDLTINNSGTGSTLDVLGDVIGQGVLTVTGSPVSPTQTNFTGDVLTQNLVVGEHANVNVNGAAGQGDTSVAPGATLSGDGSVLGNLAVAGTISPGNSSGIFAVSGDATLDATSTLMIELSGNSTPGVDYDMLDVTGALTAGGSLDVALTSGFNPQLGDMFDILNFGSATGPFSSLTLPPLAAGLAWDTSNLLTTGVLAVGLAGDANGDGTVDAADYVVLRDGGGPGSLVDDFNTWRDNFGVLGGSPVASSWSPAVPEPASAVVLLTGLLGLIARRRSEA